MRLGIFAKTFPGESPHTVLPAVAAAGFKAAQYNMACSGLASMPEAIPDAAARAVNVAAAEAGVEVSAVSGTFNMIHPDLDERRKGLVRLEVIAAAAGKMGTALITLCTGTRDPKDQWRWHPDNASVGAWRDLVASIVEAVEIAERHGVQLGIEPELANVVSSAQRARQLLDEVASPALRIVIDPANLFEVESRRDQQRIVGDAIELLGAEITMGHAKDRLPDGQFAAAGTGVLDYKHYLHCLARVGFDGTLVAHGLSAAEAPVAAAFLSARIAEARG
jgi:sugar phosphate isomerase/epimerase